MKTINFMTTFLLYPIFTKQIRDDLFTFRLFPSLNHIKTTTTFQKTLGNRFSFSIFNIIRKAEQQSSNTAYFGMSKLERMIKASHLVFESDKGVGRGFNPEVTVPPSSSCMSLASTEFLTCHCPLSFARLIFSEKAR